MEKNIKNGWEQKMIENRLPLNVKNLSFSFEEDEEKKLKNISFSASKGDSIFVLGPSGAGKSTLTLCLNGLYPEAVDGSLNGEVQIFGRDLSSFETGEACQYVGVVFQNPDNQFCMLTLEDEVAFGLENINYPKENMEERIDEMLSLVGLLPYKQSSISILSGGQKQKLALACVLALQPDILILDEPTANLDPASTKELVSLVSTLQEEYKFTLLVIEHKLDDWVHLIKRCLVFNKDGEMILDTSLEDCFKHHYELLIEHGTWIPHISSLAYTGIEKGWYKKGALPLSMEEFLKGLQSSPPFFNRKKKKREKETLIDVQDVSFSYQKKGPSLLTNLSFKIGRGEIVALIGTNGAGKSTLSTLLSRLKKPSSGQILLENKNLKEWDEKTLRQKTGYVFQNPEHQFVTDSVFEEVAFGLRLQGLLEEEVTEKTKHVLEVFQLLHVRDQNPFSLSQGQKRRLSVATMLVDEQSFLILDEPTFGQDAQTTKELLTLLDQRVKDGTTVLLITHDMELVHEKADRVLVLHEGKLLFNGPTEFLWEEQALLEKANLDLPLEIKVQCALEKEGDLLAT